MVGIPQWPIPRVLIELSIGIPFFSDLRQDSLTFFFEAFFSWVEFVGFNFAAKNCAVIRNAMCVVWSSFPVTAILLYSMTMLWID